MEPGQVRRYVFTSLSPTDQARCSVLNTLEFVILYTCTTIEQRIPVIKAGKNKGPDDMMTAVLVQILPDASDVSKLVVESGTQSPPPGRSLIRVLGP